MYTLTDDVTGEDHYRDFARTYRFLAQSDQSSGELEALLTAFRRELVGTGSANLPRLKELKELIERKLRLVMCRTERLASDVSREGMLIEAPTPSLETRPQDLQSYLALQRVADGIEEGDVLEYWMSSPFLVNFMERYKLKESFDAAKADPELRGRLAKLLQSASATPPGLAGDRGLRRGGLCQCAASAPYPRHDRAGRMEDPLDPGEPSVLQATEPIRPGGTLLLHQASHLLVLESGAEGYRRAPQLRGGTVDDPVVRAGGAQYSGGEKEEKARFCGMASAKAGSPGCRFWPWFIHPKCSPMLRPARAALAVGAGGLPDLDRF